MQFRTVLDVKVVDVEKRRNPSKHYVSGLALLRPCHLIHLCPIELYQRWPVHSHSMTLNSFNGIQAYGL